MGIKGIYQEIGPGRRVALSKLAVDKFEHTGRPLRIAIDVSIWLFQIQASKGGTNPALRTFYYRLLRLIALSIHPIFVFDGPNKPPFKRNKRTGGPGVSVASIPEFLAKQLLKQFGFPLHLAPGEAEAECALLQREGIVDAVLSEDVDTLMFGSGVTIRNWSPEHKSAKTPTHVNVYDAAETKNGPSGLDREGMILVALMSGGDYVPEGIPGCGPKKACEAARAGFGTHLCRLARNDAKGLREWREQLQHEIKTNESKFFAQKRPSLVIPDDFPRTDILGYYTHPAVSNQAALDRLRSSIKWDHDLDFPGLRSFTCDAFDWVGLEGAKHFVRSLAPSLLVRHLRVRGEQTERYPLNGLQAIQEDEALLVKGIHGKRQHAVTDNSTELRVSFTPIELVKIDLSIEKPDDEVNTLSATEANIYDEIPLEVDDDAEEGPRKRGPSQFDPHKPARVWVLETYVKVGVPLKVQDWEATRQRLPRSKRTASANDVSTIAHNQRGGRGTKVDGNTHQVSIRNFTRVKKPSTRNTQVSSKTRGNAASQPATSIKDNVVSLLSSSSPRSGETDSLQYTRGTSLSPPVELPSSVTRRRRGQMQRAYTLPSKHTTCLDRPESPTLHVIETLDLVDLHPTVIRSQAPAKRTRLQVTENPTTSCATRAATVTVSPEKARQTTLDEWRSPERSSENPRKRTPPLDTISKSRRPRFEVGDGDLETLDLTLSSPSNPSAGLEIVLQEPRRTSNRPPLRYLSPNASTVPENSSSTAQDTPPIVRAKILVNSRRTSPRFQRKQSASPETSILDLTGSSSPSLLDTTNSLSPPKNLQSACRRSPRAHATTALVPSARKVSPPVEWQLQDKRKREVILRKSLAGTWTFLDVRSPAEARRDDRKISKGKESRRWRESEIDFLDMC